MSIHVSAQFRHAAKLISTRFPFYTPLLILCLGTLLLRFTDLDFQISSHFYDAQSSRWPLMDVNPWEFIDQWCILPGILLGLCAMLISTYGLIRRQWNPWTRGAFLITTVLLVGPGLLVNGILKPTFSRPRPREVVPLGGTEAYQPVFGFGEGTDFNASFPSGHASIGFFLITPAFLFRRKHRTRRLIFFTGLLFGSVMAISRVVQGGHYFSDVLWSLAIIYFTAWATLLLMTAHEYRAAENPSVKTDLAHSALSEIPLSVERSVA